jgi:hypothetical protein
VQLDKTSIAIRERGFLDILDLALRVIQGYAGPLAAAALVGIVPLALFNHWLLSGALVGNEFDDLPAGYLWYMSLLIIWEIPLATAPITLYLGQVLFLQPAKPRELYRALVAALPQLLVLQGLMRGLFVLLAIWGYLKEADDGLLALLGFLLVMLWFFLYAFWPYLNEIILLERNPLRRRKGGISTLGRTRAIHAHATSDLIGRWLLSTLIASVLIVAVWQSLVVLRSFLTFHEGFDRFSVSVLLVGATWLVVAFYAVVRFLSYLDLRIRTEGWEIELVMRAEGARLARQVT